MRLLSGAYSDLDGLATCRSLGRVLQASFLSCSVGGVGFSRSVSAYLCFMSCYWPALITSANLFGDIYTLYRSHGGKNSFMCDVEDFYKLLLMNCNFICSLISGF